MGSPPISELAQPTTRVRARAWRVIGSCIGRNRTVAIWAWNLKWALSGDRLDFEANLGAQTISALAQPTARVRALDKVSVLY